MNNDNNSVVVTDVKMGIDKLFVLMLKLSIAAIPAAIVFAIIAFIGSAVLAGIFVAA
jgi:hypothetical protein